MTYDERINPQQQLANMIIKGAFKDKKDLAGQPYINHIFRVSQKIQSAKGAIVATLHDLLEDFPQWNEQSLRDIFDCSIVDAVVCLTKKKGEQYEDYIDRINSSTISFVKEIKIADLVDNMDITRFNVRLEEKDIIRLKKYHAAYMKLNS